MTIDVSTRARADSALILQSYLAGVWRTGAAQGDALLNPVSGEALAYASSDGLDLVAALDHTRRIGGPALRALDFSARAGLLGRIAALRA